MVDAHAPIIQSTRSRSSAGGPRTIFPSSALFLQSDTIVKLVLLLLLVASFWSWAVIFDKFMRLRRLRPAAPSFEETLLVGRLARRSLRPRRPRPVDPMSRGVRRGDARMAAQRRQGLRSPAGMRAGLQQRIERVMNVTVGREMDRA